MSEKIIPKIIGIELQKKIKNSIFQAGIILACLAALLATTIFQKMVTALSIVIIGYSVLPELIGMLQAKAPFLQSYSKCIPFYGGWLGINSTIIKIQSIVGMLLFGVLFLIVSIKIARCQDFK